MSVITRPSFLASPLRVLIVEDSAEILESLSLALKMEGVEIVSRQRASGDTLRWLKSNPAGCDVVILDIFLLSGSGLDVLRDLPSLPSPPVAIVLTNYANESLRRKCQALGAAKVFDKSSEVENMMAWLGGMTGAKPL